MKRRSGNKIQRAAARFFSLFINNKKLFWVTALLLFGFIVLFIDYLRNKLNSKDHWDNVLVEMHGMVMDIIVFGILITIYEEIKERRSEKKELREEIDDFKNWETNEATNRIIGAIKKLNRMGVYQIELNNARVKRIDLSHCKFIDAKLNDSTFNNAVFDHTFMRKVNIKSSEFYACHFRFKTDMHGCYGWNSKFFGTEFSDVYLGFSNFSTATFSDVVIRNSYMNDCNFRKATFRDVKLHGTKFTSSDLRETVFIRAVISSETDFEGCMVDSVSWIEDMDEEKIINFHFLAERYFVEERRYSDSLGIRYYKIAERERIADPIPPKRDIFKTDNIEGISLE